MSGQLTQFGANRAVVAGVGQDQSATAGMYIGLCTALPGSPDTATLANYNAVEVATSGYQRQGVTWDSPSGDPSEIGNAAQLNFGPFSANPPEVAAAFLTDTSTGTSGNVMAYWELDTPRDAENGDTLFVAAGDLTISVD